MLFGRIFGLFSRDMAMDLGTANTLIYVKDEGIVLDEPSVVAYLRDSGEVIAVGREAKQFIGRVPWKIVVTRPLRDGVISDFDVTSEMIKYFIRKATGKSTLMRPCMVIGVPTGITQVEKRAVLEAAEEAGARETHLIEEPMAAAIGARLDVMAPTGNMVVDIGGGTTEVAVISMGAIVESESVRVAGDEADEAIVRYMLKKHHLHIGENAAEKVKMAIGSAYPLEEPLSIKVAGKDVTHGVPRTVEVTDEEIRQAISEPVRTIVDAVHRVFERTPPELASDVETHGMYLVGGGALIKGIDRLLQESTGIHVVTAESPLTTVVEGCGITLENIKDWKSVFIS